MNRYCLAFVSVLAANAALGQTKSTSPSPDNAATSYLAAFAKLPGDSRDPAYRTVSDWDTVPLDDKVDNVLATYRDTIKNLHIAAQLPECDWGLDMMEGPYLKLPQLNSARTAMCLLLLDARFDFQDGQNREAVEDVCDAMVLGRQVGKPPVLISQLIDAGIERTSDNFVAGNLAKLDPETLRQLQSRIAGLPPMPRPSETALTERKLYEWYIRQIESDPNLDIQQMFLKLQSGANEVDQAMSDTGNTRDGMLIAIKALLPYYDSLGALLDKKLHQDELEKQSTALFDQYHAMPAGNLLVFSFTRAIETIDTSQTRLVELNAAIAIVQNGPDKIKDFKDPINGDPLEYKKNDNGFEIDSTVMLASKPVVLTVAGK